VADACAGSSSGLAAVDSTSQGLIVLDALSSVWFS
jgi:hypothetical protein